MPEAAPSMAAVKEVRAVAPATTASMVRTMAMGMRGLMSRMRWRSRGAAALP